MRLFFVIVAGGVIAMPAIAQQPNYDEAKVPNYTLPALLRAADGSPVADAATWYNKRRPEILSLFEKHVYGKMPASPPAPCFDVLEEDPAALGGIAVRRQVAVYLTGETDGPRMDLLIYIPNTVPRPAPTFLGLNFFGNHNVHDDPAILLARGWLRNNPEFGITENRATEASRGMRENRWPVDQILSRGYALATAYYGDIEPDDPAQFDRSIRKRLLRPGQERPDDDEWGAIGAWAWGLSRAMDYFQTDPDIDTARVIVMGHSRLGKTALWAGAVDERFAVVISNNSGCGGAALSRRRFGETVKLINDRFPHWFCGNFKQYNDREEDCPVDQHMLLALCAPRLLYVASAEEDRWADPRGEFLAAVHATPVYRLLGKQGLPAKKMPAVDRPVMGTVGYHVRTGKHDVTEYDWQRYMDFCDRNLPRLNSVRKIWDRAEHSAFTDLIRFRNRWYCCFREADSHAAGRDGIVRILVSDDGESWNSAAEIAEDGVDLRDPKLSITPDKRLMAVMGGSVYRDGKFITRQSRVSFSGDGSHWTPPRRVLDEGDWLWRVTWHKGTAYAVVYNPKPPEQYAPWNIRLVRSQDGLAYDLIGCLHVPDRAGETTLRFLDGDEMMLLTRREEGDRFGWIGVSKPPYTEWSWRSTQYRLGGPNFIQVPDGGLWAGSRLHRVTRSGGSAPFTCLARMDRLRYTPALILPSGGDTSYPGLVWHDGLLWISYYSSHEGKSAIYLAQVDIPKESRLQRNVSALTVRRNQAPR